MIEFWAGVFFLSGNSLNFFRVSTEARVLGQEVINDYLSCAVSLVGGGVGEGIEEEVLFVFAIEPF
jgi:hypothetical protein